MIHCSVLEQYHDRQIIMNYYDHEETLYKRDGLDFDNIKVTDTTIDIIKNESILLSIYLHDYLHLCINTEFQNYYTLKNTNSQLDIYFP